MFPGRGSVNIFMFGSFLTVLLFRFFAYVIIFRFISVCVIIIVCVFCVFWGFPKPGVFLFSFGSVCVSFLQCSPGRGVPLCLLFSFVFFVFVVFPRPVDCLCFLSTFHLCKLFVFIVSFVFFRCVLFSFLLIYCFCCIEVLFLLLVVLC